MLFLTFLLLVVPSLAAVEAAVGWAGPVKGTVHTDAQGRRLWNLVRDSGCGADHYWVNKGNIGYMGYDWGEQQAIAACGGVYPRSYLRGGDYNTRFCCPDYPFTKKAKKCQSDCNRFAKEWIGDKVCDLEDCGNCPSFWQDSNTFDGGDCGKVKVDEVAVGRSEVEVGAYHGDPALKSEPLERKQAIEGLWNGYGTYHLHKADPSDNTCSGGQWVQTTLTGYLNFDWQRHDGFQACGGVHPIKYQKDGSMDKVQFCCPDFPYTKKAKKCDRNDKNFGCTKYAKEWKGDGVCDLEDCGNCPAMWDKNKFDGGDCGYVEYESAVGQAGAMVTMHEVEAGASTMGVVVQGFAAVGLAATLFGAFRFYTSK